jgi:hypothetical protein
VCLWLRPSNPQDFGHSHQIGQGPCAHFFHSVAAVNLYGNLAHAQFSICVHQTSGHQDHHLPLAGGQGFKKTLQTCNGLFPVRSRGQVLLTRKAEGVGIAPGTSEKASGACGHDVRPTGPFERKRAVSEHADDPLAPMYVAHAAGLYKP